MSGRHPYSLRQASEMDRPVANQDSTQVIDLAEMPVQVPMQMDEELTCRSGDFKNDLRILGVELLGRKVFDDLWNRASQLRYARPELTL